MNSTKFGSHSSKPPSIGEGDRWSWRWDYHGIAEGELIIGACPFEHVVGWGRHSVGSGDRTSLRDDPTDKLLIFGSPKAGLLRNQGP